MSRDMDFMSHSWLMSTMFCQSWPSAYLCITYRLNKYKNKKIII